MAAVTNQPPYEEVKPIPVPRDVCPNLMKTILRVALAVAVTGFFTAFGLAVGLLEVGVSPFTGSVLGGIVGVVISIAAAMWVPIPSKVCQYRLETLKQVEKNQANPHSLSALRNLTHFLTYPLEKFTQYSQHHMFHHALTNVTDRLDPQRPDVAQVWKAFLQHLHGTKMLTPDGQKIELDFSTELNRMQGKQISVTYENLGSGFFGPSESDLAQVEQLQKMCFGVADAMTKEKMKALLAADSSNGCIVARNKETKEIIGFGWYYKQDDKIQIGGIGRKPSAARLGIGFGIMQALVDGQQNGIPLQIKMRKSNQSAVHFLKKWEFFHVEDLPKGYPSGPAEDGILMQLSWSKYRQLLASTG